MLVASSQTELGNSNVLPTFSRWLFAIVVSSFVVASLGVGLLAIDRTIKYQLAPVFFGVEAVFLFTVSIFSEIAKRTMVSDLLEPSAFLQSLRRTPQTVDRLVIFSFEIPCNVTDTCIYPCASLCECSF